MVVEERGGVRREGGRERDRNSEKEEREGVGGGEDRMMEGGEGEGREGGQRNRREWRRGREGV